MPTKFMTVALLVLTAVVAGGAVYLLKPSTNVNVSVSIEQMRAIAELATAEWTMSAFVERPFQSQGLFKKFTSDYVIARVSGKVRGSVNMEKVDLDRRDTPDSRQVVMHFGRGSIIVSGVEYNVNDPDRFRTVSCNRSLTNCSGEPANLGQTDALRKEGEEQLRRKAIENGIVEKTKQNAKTALSNFVRSLGYQATITFDEKAYDPSLEKASGAGPS